MKQIRCAFALCAVLAASACAAAGGGQAPDPANATWHIGLVDVWGQGKGLDIYTTFEKGRWARALATARRFNTCIHLVRKADVTRQGDRLTGSLDILLTPDPWVPKDGQTIPMKVQIDGKLAPGD